ncbi:MAG: hypothetical protein EOM20_12910 [Spartobacteria bacterium]|nr:hypothetical protein [Spartobacteria bacterium]
MQQKILKYFITYCDSVIYNYSKFLVNDNFGADFAFWSLKMLIRAHPWLKKWVIERAKNGHKAKNSHFYGFLRKNGQFWQIFGFFAEIGRFESPITCRTAAGRIRSL